MSWLAVVAASAVLVACGGGSDNDAGTSNSGAGSSAAGPQTVRLVMKDNVFEPKEITVPRGSEITFETKNEGQAIHNVVVMAKSAEGKDILGKALLQPGETDKFTATFTKAGTLKFQCTFHLPDMTGTLTVK